jgi:hypothetical protein
MDAKTLLKILLFFLFFLSLPFFLREATQGFRFSKLEFDFPSDPKWEVFLDPSVESILSQDFKYLGKGAQVYVFESKDHQYVVKLFRFDRKKKEEKILLLFRACKMAYENLQEETGLIYVHLNPGSLPLPLFQATDPLGRSFALPIDRYRFVIQKKAIPFEEALLEAKRDPALMKKRLMQFLTLLKERSAKGVWNKDPNLARNFGFLETKAIELDFGSYRFNPFLNQEKEVERYSLKMRKWLLKNAPEWVGVFDELKLDFS